MRHVTCIIALLLLQRPVLAADATALRPWPEYRTIMWVGKSAYRKPEKIPLFFERMRELGINAVTLHADAANQPALAQHFPFYVENIVNRGLCLKFNSNVRDWDKFIRGWMEGGRPDTALVRDYSLDDPSWLGSARRQMQAAARQAGEHGPLAYDIRDELSTTISANPFDYDFGPASLAGFRVWLKTQYADLAALNAEWETQFAAWDEVRPFTTDQIKQRMATRSTGSGQSGAAALQPGVDWAALRRVKFDAAQARQEPTRWNFAPWADFRTYMDIALSRALGELRAAARAVDPQTPVGIEGTQMPSAFGGYDLWRLAQVLDWVEPYDIGGAREIFGSFMPGKPILTTVFEKETRTAQRRLWHLLLEGDRGCIIWWSEDCLDWASDDYAPTAKARALAPVLHELQSPLGQLFLQARRETDPIYFVYSQPSLQVDWLLESIPDGASWPRRFSSFEANHNQLARRRVGWLKLCQDLGYTPQFIAAERLSELARGGPKGAALLVADALALAEGEARAVAELARAGAAVMGNGPIAAFDEHGRLRRESATPSVVAGGADPGQPASARPATAYVVQPADDIGGYLAHRLRGTDAGWLGWAEAQLRIPREVSVPAATHTRIHRYRLGSARLLAFERNIVYHMSEDLKQAGGNEPLEQPVEVEAKLAAAAHVYELRTGKYVGHTDRLIFTLDPWRPSLFAVLPEKAAGGDVVAELLER